MVARPFWSVGRGRKAHLESWDWLGEPGEVGYPSRRARRVGSQIPVGREWSGGTPGDTGGVGRLIRMVVGVGSPPKRAGRSWESLPVAERVVKSWKALLEG